MSVKTLPYDGDLSRWLAIEYGGYWDFARMFRLTYQGMAFVFDSPYLEMQDEYAGHFIVYRCDATSDSFTAAISSGTVVDILPVEKIVFDESRKQHVLKAALAEAWKNWEGK